MHHPPHPQVETEFETSVLGNQVGDGHRDRAGSISHRHALQFPQKPEQVVGERRLAELNVHIAAMSELCPGAVWRNLIVVEQGRPCNHGG
jgi:hypothetical protein